MLQASFQTSSIVSNYMPDKAGRRSGSAIKRSVPIRVRKSRRQGTPILDSGLLVADWQTQRQDAQEFVTASGRVCLMGGSGIGEVFLAGPLAGPEMP